MEMKAAIDRFNYSVWIVLDIIKNEMISRGRTITYYFNADITRTKPLTYPDEARAIEYLIKNKVIKETETPDSVGTGLPGEYGSTAGLVYHFKVGNKFREYYDTFLLKVSANIQSKDTNDTGRLAKKQVLEFIENNKLGKKQRKLLTLLSDMKPIDNSELELKAKTKNLVALVRDTKKVLKSSAFEIRLVRSKSISKGNSYQLLVLSE